MKGLSEHYEYRAICAIKKRFGPSIMPYVIRRLHDAPGPHKRWRCTDTGSGAYIDFGIRRDRKLIVFEAHNAGAAHAPSGS